MMAMRFLFPIRMAALAVCLWSPSLFAQEEAADRPVVQLEGVTIGELLQREGESVTVRGFVESTRTNAAGIHFLQFRGSEFVCVTFARFVKEFEEGPPSEIYADKWLEVSGEIEDYRGTPQIKLLSPGQVRVIDAPPPPPPAVAEMEDEREEMPEAEEEKPEDVSPVVVESAPGGPVVEVIDGVRALDWRKYFPENPEEKSPGGG